MLSKKHCLLLAAENIKKIILRILEKSQYLGFICHSRF